MTELRNGLEQVGIAWKQNGAWRFEGFSCAHDDPESNTGQTWAVYRTISGEANDAS